MSTQPDRTADGPAPGRRVAAVVLIVMAASLPWVATGMIRALKSTSNDPRQWLPRDFDETDTHDWFQQQFGIDEIAVVSWPGCTLDDPRVEQLAADLEQSKYFHRVLSGPRALEQLRKLRIKRQAAIERLRGTLIGPDEKTTCLVAEISTHGQEDRSAAVAYIVETAESSCGLSPDVLRMGGPTVDAAAIDAESRKLLFQMAGLSGLVSLLVAGLRLRSVWLAAIVLVGAVYSTALSLAVVHYSGGRMNLLMTMLPPLIYILTISASVHLVNYYRDAVRDGAGRRAAKEAIAHGWLPCVLASATTAIGLISLAGSRIVPIQEFGVYASIGMVVSLVIVLLFLPAALRLLPVVRSSSPRPVDREAERETVGERLGMWFFSRVTRSHAVVTFGCLLLMVFFGLGLSRVDSTVKLQDRFVENSRIISDYHWLEENMGPLVPMEVVVRFDADSPLNFHERMQLVANVEHEIAELDDVGATISAVAFAREIEGGGARQMISKVLAHKGLENNQLRLVDSHFLAEDEGDQLWRISVRADALGDLDYGRFTNTLEQRVRPLLKEDSEAKAEAVYTGVIPLIYKAQRQLLGDLVRSFVTAFAVIALVMMVVLRSVRAGMLAMLPNLFPAVLIFGGMGWLGIFVQIGSVMTASAALGIAVDDTVHFLTWFRRGLQEQLDRHAALGDAFRRCAGAMMHTTLICGGGLAVFGISSFVPILHFAWLMVLLLLAALIGDLVLLPALLAGPFGRIMSKERKSLESYPTAETRADSAAPDSDERRSPESEALKN